MPATSRWMHRLGQEAKEPKKAAALGLSGWRQGGRPPEEEVIAAQEREQREALLHQALMALPERERAIFACSQVGRPAQDLEPSCRRTGREWRAGTTTGKAWLCAFEERAFSPLPPSARSCLTRQSLCDDFPPRHVV